MARSYASGSVGELSPETDPGVLAVGSRVTMEAAFHLLPYRDEVVAPKRYET